MSDEHAHMSPRPPTSVARAPGTPGPGTKRRVVRKKTAYHHGGLRPALINAAVSLIEREGPGEWTLRAAARKAGVTHAAPYRHFKDKKELLSAVAEEGFSDLIAWLRAELETAGEVPLARLRAVAVGHVRFALAHPAYYRVMFGPESFEKPAPPSLHAAATAAFQLLLDEVIACQRAGAVRGGDPMDLAVFGFSAMHGLAELMMTRQLEAAGMTTQRLASLGDRIAQMVYEGMAPR